MDVVISKSKKADKKYDAVIDGKKTISFGQKGASDMTLHKDKDRKQAYMNRHKKRENWGASGVDTAGFWSKNLLWNKDTLKGSVDDINKKYRSINIKLK